MRYRYVRHLAFGAAISASSIAFSDTSRESSFYSWYDGWGSHQVWGVGKVSAEYAKATVRCGPVTVNVLPIYDTHGAAGQPPGREQTVEFAQAHNARVLKKLESNGLRCEIAEASKPVGVQ